MELERDLTDLGIGWREPDDDPSETEPDAPADASPATPEGRAEAQEWLRRKRNWGPGSADRIAVACKRCGASPGAWCVRPARRGPETGRVCATRGVTPSS